MEDRTRPDQTTTTENRRAQTHQTIDPSDIAHHLRVAADKYHEHARVLLEDMNEAIQALPDERKPAYRHTREDLAKLFDDQASDALRLAEMFDDATTDTLAGVPVILYGTCDPEAARNLAEAARALDSAFDGGNLIRDRLVAGEVDLPAIPGGRAVAACDHELTTAIAAADGSTGGDLCTRCGAPIDHNEPHVECDACRAGVPTDDHAACEHPLDTNQGSLQHTPTTPTTWIGNEQLNRQVGGAP